MTDTLEISNTLAEELSKPTPYESARKTIERMLNDVNRTSITPSNDVVDAMLDLMVDIEKLNDLSKALVNLMRGQREQLDYYEEMFGEVEIPEGWEPAWFTSQSEDSEVAG